MGNSPKHRDAKSSEFCEALDEHATFRLGINYGLRGAFTHGQPMSREQYEAYLRGPAGAYFSAPPYQEYLTLYERYSEACRVRDEKGMSDGEAAEVVQRRIDAEKYKYLGPLE